MRKMKDSGIEWIGEIPESWDVGKLGYFIQVFKKKHGVTPKEYRNRYFRKNLKIDMKHI